MAPKTPLKCCVGGCDSSSITNKLYSVPKNDELRSLWLSYLVPTNSSLLGLTKFQLKNKKVCEKHFDQAQFDENGVRVKSSYPSLFTQKEIAHGIPLSTGEYNVPEEHNYFSTQVHDDDDTGTAIVLRGNVCMQQEHTYAVYSTSQPTDISQDGQGSTEKPRNTVYEAMDIDDGEFKTVTNPCPDATGSLIGDTKQTNRKSLAQRRKGTQLFSKTRRYVKQCTTIALDSIGLTSTERIQSAETLAQNAELMENFEKMSKKAKTFLIMQLRLARKNKMARRFSLEDKLLALSIMKSSPKCYKLLESMFALPSRRTLSRVSEKVVFNSGINENVFKHLQNTIKNWDQKKRLCSIVFDEVALTPRLTFNEKQDRIHGFVDIAGERKARLADHALVFMIRGICSSWRQSIAYYFCEGTVAAAELQIIFKQLLPKLRESGLIPLAIVCDQGSTFRSCLNSLKLATERIRFNEGKNDSDNTSIHIAGSDLFVFHDPPHLLKSIRNNFLDKDILFNGKVASWKDIEYVYDIDSTSGHTRALPKLTAQNVDRNQIKKMKVKAAAQVLSATTAAMLEYTHSIHKRLNADKPSMITTAEVVSFFDDLFDSVNGSPGATKGKLRTAVTPQSPHIQFWRQSLRQMEKIRFIDENSKIAKQAGKPRHVSVPCIGGWITTLRSFLGLANLLFCKYEVDYFYPRFINQDPLEIFFGRIRAMNSRNINPDANAFIYSFKSLMISNILSPHSKFSNCEDDTGNAVLYYESLFNCDEENKENYKGKNSNSSQTQSKKRKIDTTSKNATQEKIRVQISAYTAGYMCRKITKKIHCHSCSETYLAKDIQEEGIHQYIKYREFKKLKNNNLAYPNEKFLRLYRMVSQYIHDYIDDHHTNIKKDLRKRLMKCADMSWLGCKKHKIAVLDFFICLIIRLHVHNWCNRINKILGGKIEKKYVSQMGNVAELAYNKYEKYRLRKKKLNK